MVQRWRGHNAKRSQHFVLFALGLERESRPRRLSWSLRDDNSWSDLEGWRSLGAVAGRRLTPFHGADGADALQGIGRQWQGLVRTMIAGGLRSLAAVVRLPTILHVCRQRHAIA